MMFFTPGFAQCVGDFNDDNSLYIINCEPFDASETIASATYSLNGVDMGTGIGFNNTLIPAHSHLFPILSSQPRFHCQLLCRL